MHAKQDARTAERGQQVVQHSDQPFLGRLAGGGDHREARFIEKEEHGFAPLREPIYLPLSQTLEVPPDGGTVGWECDQGGCPPRKAATPA